MTTPGTVHPDLVAWLDRQDWAGNHERRRRTIYGLAALQDLARQGVQTISYTAFDRQIRGGSRYGNPYLGDIGHFCNEAGWPNVVCFVVRKDTGRTGHGFTDITSDDEEELRDAAWLAYGARKNGPLAFTSPPRDALR